MANRVLLDPNGMKVSRPGVDVLTAGDADLLFSSDFSQTPVHMKGIVTFSSSSIRTLNFGRTFLNMPMVTFLVSYSSFYGLYINDWVESGSLSSANAYVRVRNSSFTYYAPNRDGLVMRYIVWDLNL